MLPSPEMASFVNACEVKHASYIGEPGDKLRLKLGTRDLTLIIERLRTNIVRVAHETVDASGEIVVDPEVLFFTGYEKWIAIEVRGALSVPTEVGRRSTHKKYVTLNSTETAVKACSFAKQKELQQFVKYWAKSLRNRKWHEISKDTRFEQTSFLDDSDVYDNDDGEEGEASTERVRNQFADMLEDEGLLVEVSGIPGKR